MCSTRPFWCRLSALVDTSKYPNVEQAEQKDDDLKSSLPWSFKIIQGPNFKPCKPKNCWMMSVGGCYDAVGNIQVKQVAALIIRRYNVKLSCKTTTCKSPFCFSKMSDNTLMKPKSMWNCSQQHMMEDSAERLQGRHAAEASMHVSHFWKQWKDEWSVDGRPSKWLGRNWN